MGDGRLVGIARRLRLERLVAGRQRPARTRRQRIARQQLVVGEGGGLVFRQALRPVVVADQPRRLFAVHPQHLVADALADQPRLGAGKLGGDPRQLHRPVDLHPALDGMLRIVGRGFRPRQPAAQRRRQHGDLVVEAGVGANRGREAGSG